MTIDNLYFVNTLKDLQTIIEGIKRGHYRLTVHAAKQMNDRKMTHADLKSVAETMKAGTAQNNGTYLIVGFCENGKGAGFSAKIDGMVVIVTVFKRKLSKVERGTL